METIFHIRKGEGGITPLHLPIGFPRWGHPPPYVEMQGNPEKARLSDFGDKKRLLFKL